MTISFDCPHCGRRIRVKDEAAGKTGKCVDCGKSVVIPQKRATAELVRKQAPPADDEADFFEDLPAEIEYPRPLGRRSPQRPAQPVAVQVNVQPPSQAAHSLGIASVILGALAFLICWIPFVGVLGMPLSGLGLLLGIAGVIIGALRKGRGIGFSIAGSAICLMALVIAFVFTSAVVHGVNEAVASARKQRGTEKRALPERAAPDSDVAPKAVSDPPAADEKKAPPPDPWAAAGQAASDGTLRVHVASARIAKVPLKEIGRDGESEEPQLMIRLELENLSAAKKLDYRGWAGGHFGFRDVASLEDEAGNRYKRITFGIGEVAGQRKSGSIYPTKTVDDVLVFEVPVDAAKTLRLTLPAHAYGGEGELRIAIPTASIER